MARTLGSFVETRVMDWMDEIEVQRRAMAVWRQAALIVPNEDNPETANELLSAADLAEVLSPTVGASMLDGYDRSVPTGM